MILHGWGKLQMMLDGEFENFGDPIGLGKSLSLILVVIAEVGCAALIMIGLATRLATVPIIIAMSVAAFVVHGADPWTMGAGASKEPALLFLTVYLTLLFTGAGKFSADNLICGRFCKKREDA